MKLNQACRLLAERVDELTGEAQQVKEGLIGLLTDPAALAQGRAVEAAFGEAAVLIGNSLQDIAERLRILNEVISDLQSVSPDELTTR